MSKNIVLKFRDLITEEEGTINEHRDLISTYGEVWWGWWMKQDEISPIDLFRQLAEEIKTSGSTTAYLFDTGLLKFYKANIIKILVAPINNKLRTPNPETSPTYYHRGSYPAWFLLNEIEEVPFESLSLQYIEFPTRPENKERYESDILKEVSSLDELKLKGSDVTLWVVNTK